MLIQKQKCQTCICLTQYKIHLPNHACWSPWTSIASPKSASLTAAPLLLLASRRFSGFRSLNISEHEHYSSDQDGESGSDYENHYL